MKNKIKDKLMAIRLPKETYQKYIEKALKKGQQEKRVVTVSEVIREVLEKNK